MACGEDSILLGNCNAQSAGKVISPEEESLVGGGRVFGGTVPIHCTSYGHSFYQELVRSFLVLPPPHL